MLQHGLGRFLNAGSIRVYLLERAVAAWKRLHLSHVFFSAVQASLINVYLILAVVWFCPLSAFAICSIRTIQYVSRAKHNDS